MTTLETLRTSVAGLRTNLGRSLLTMLGIVIGVAAVVLVLSLSFGARTLILRQVESIGGETIVVRPGRQPKGPSDVAQTLFDDSLKTRDVDALRRKSNVPGARVVEPLLFVPGSVAYRERVYRPEIFGWNAETLADIFSLAPAEGRFFSADDVRARAHVAVLGARVREELFGATAALGETIRIKQSFFRVVGVLEKSGQVGFLSTDEVVVIPSSVARTDLLGIDYYHEIFVHAESAHSVGAVADDIRRTLRETHGITDQGEDDFFVVTQEDLLARLGIVTQVLTIFLFAITAISLVVGGVGIMNIMLVSVKERTREIGLRKAVGATNADILRQFLCEAILLTVGGGVVGTASGIALSVGIALVIQRQFNLAWEFHFPISTVLLGLGMATAVGLLFGLHPARDAARKDPIEALRYE